MKKKILAFVAIAIGLLELSLGEQVFGVHYLLIAPFFFGLMMYVLYKFVIVQNSTEVGK